MSGAGGAAIHPRICGNGLALGEEGLAGQLRFAAAAGFPAWGLPAAQLIEAEGRSAAVPLAHVLLPSLFSLAEPERWPAETERALAATDAAAAAGAPRLVFTTGPAGGLSFEDAAAALAIAIGPVHEHAERRGIALLAEIGNQLRDDLGFLHTLRDAVDVAAELGTGVCADLLWCWRERELEATLRRGAGLIGLVQVSDCEPGSTSMPCRVVPGDGAIPLDRVLAAVLESGYTGPFDLELLGPRIDAEGGRGALSRGAERLGALLADLGA